MAPHSFSPNMSPSSPLLALRSIPGDINNVKNTFSSWDNCMAQNYCKWPVIVAIIIVSCIVLSVLLCVVRCCCCGVECCCAACSCMNACCPSPRGGKNKSKYRDAAPPPHHGYQSTPGPFYGDPSVPQFATFDASKKVHADSLPAMPSWDNATSKKVVDDRHPEEVEMDKMDQHDETKPMLAHGASPQVGGMGYDPHGATPYSDTAAGAYGHDGYSRQQTGVIGAAAAGGALNRQQAGSAQGYRGPNDQRPGIGFHANSYTSGQGYNQNESQQGFGPAATAAGAYHSRRQQDYQQDSQYQRQGYGNDHSTSYDQSGYNGHGGDAYNNYAPAKNQSFGAGVSPPQPTYTGQQEYGRTTAQTPASLSAGYRGGNDGYGASPQQSYQSYQGGQRQGQGQGQWREI